MSSSRKHPDYWILRELREVELPESLLARLKEIGESPDDICNILKAVPRMTGFKDYDFSFYRQNISSNL